MFTNSLFIVLLTYYQRFSATTSNISEVLARFKSDIENSFSSIRIRKKVIFNDALGTHLLTSMLQSEVKMKKKKIRSKTENDVVRKIIISKCEIRIAAYRFEDYLLSINAKSLRI